MKFLSFTGNLLLIIVIFALAALGVSAQTTFSNSAAITINDFAAASPYPSSVTVSGLSGTIAPAPGSVKVRINNFSHSYSADVGMVLVGPTGAAFLIQNYAGDDKISDVTYTLSDDAAQTLPFNGVWTSGSYQPTAYEQANFPAPGPGAAYNSPAADGTATFASTFGDTNPNGVWKLYVADFDSPEAGSIAGGWSLTITSTGIAAPPARANVDFNGDGKTDFAVTRGTTSPFTEKPSQSAAVKSYNHPKSYRERLQTRRRNLNAATTNAAVDMPLYWYYNTDGMASAANVFRFGSFPFDDAIPEDFDGDGKDDIAVARQGANNQSTFYILQSSDGTVKSAQFGLNNDNRTVVGDYDGDGKADLATFRCPDFGAPAGQCYFFYRGTLNNPTNGTTYVPFGFGNDGDYLPSPGDFDGDGKYDFCLQRDTGGNQGQFVLLKSSNMAVEYIRWGRADDVLVPGDYDGDGKADFMVVRVGGNGQLNWYLLTRAGGGTGATPIVWGLADDYETPGDFDKDGKTDIVVWRPDPDPTRNYYYIRRSSDTAFQSVEWGTQDDYPIQNWYVN